MALLGFYFVFSWSFCLFCFILITYFLILSGHKCSSHGVDLCHFEVGDAGKLCLYVCGHDL